MTATSHAGFVRSAASADSELWLIERAALASDLAAAEQATPRLSADELDRAAAMPDQATAEMWCAGRIALRLLLERHCGTGIRQQPFDRAPGGRPRLEGREVDFSLSDSGPFLLIGISKHSDIGVDIELPRSFRMSPLRIDGILAAATVLDGGGADGRGARPAPLQAWVRIEAFAKAAGLPLASCLSRLGIRGHGRDPSTPAAIREQARRACEEADLRTRDLLLPHGLIGAVSLRGNLAMASPPPVQCLDREIMDRLARHRD